MEGAKGPYAPRLAGLFRYNEVDGVFEPGNTEPLGEPSVYDVVLGDTTPNDGSPVGNIGSFRLVNLPITISVTTKLPKPQLTTSPPQDDHRIRDTIAQAMADRLDLVAQSLATPGTLSTTAAGDDTGIVSGLLRGPDGSGFPLVSEGAWDWVDKRTVVHELRARAIVRIDRP